MPTLLLKLKNVPEDEHIEVCELLEQNNIPYYETNVGFWGIGMAAIWLYDNTQIAAAHELLNRYTQQRQVVAKEAYEQALVSGEARTILGTFKQQPLMFMLYLLALIGIAGLSILPFLGMM
jgi:hypothetical protein